MSRVLSGLNATITRNVISAPESLADDYIHQPIDKEFEQICFYDMIRLYKKIFKDIRKIDGKD